ncbi:MAG: M48 family metallopeptidase [Spirochaetia bacterium]
MIRSSRLLRELILLAAVIVVLAAAAFAAQRFLFSRTLLTPDIARSMDEALGPIVLSQVEMTQRALHDAAVDKAFSTIMGRLRPGLDALQPGTPQVRIVVLDSPTVNAFALPGGIICVYTGLMRNLDSAEQMAGILGHELSHVAHRDPLTLLARQVGVAALAGLLTGGRGGDLARTIAQTLVNVHYGREAEDRADEFSVQLLARSNIAPLSFRDALERIRKAEPKDPKLLLWIDTHSPIDQRIARAGEEAEKLTVKPRRIEVSWQRLIKGLPKPRE